MGALPKKLLPQCFGAVTLRWFAQSWKFCAVYSDHLLMLRSFSFKETFLSVKFGRRLIPLARLKVWFVPLVCPLHI